MLGDLTCARTQTQRYREFGPQDLFVRPSGIAQGRIALGWGTRPNRAGWPYSCTISVSYNIQYIHDAEHKPRVLRED